MRCICLTKTPYSSLHLAIPGSSAAISNMFRAVYSHLQSGKLRSAFSSLRTFANTTVSTEAVAAAGEKEDWSDAFRLVGQLAKFVGILWAVDTYGFHLSMTQGPSMMPTLNEMGDLVLVDRLSPRWDPITRNDVIIAGSPSSAASYRVCKRVIGLPGDEIWVPGRHEPIKVPEHHYWIEGDNPHNSTDSRYYGCVPSGLVYGRVVAKVWPLNECRRINREQGRPASNTLMLEEMMSHPAILAHTKQRLNERMV